jgi:hypothetical protein
MVSSIRVNDVQPHGERCKGSHRIVGKESSGHITQVVHCGIMTHRNDVPRELLLQQLIDNRAMQVHLRLLREHRNPLNAYFLPSNQYWDPPQTLNDHYCHTLAASPFTEMMAAATTRAAIPFSMPRLEHCYGIPPIASLDGTTISTNKMRESRHNTSPSWTARSSNGQAPVLIPPYPFRGDAAFGQSLGSSYLPTTTSPTLSYGHLRQEMMATRMTTHGMFATNAHDNLSETLVDMRESLSGEGPAPGRSTLKENHHKMGNHPTAAARSTKGGFNDDKCSSAITGQLPFSEPAIASTNDGTIQFNTGRKEETKRPHQDHQMVSGVTKRKVVQSFSMDGFVESRKICVDKAVQSKMDQSSPPPSVDVLCITKKKKKTKKINMASEGVPSIMESSLKPLHKPPPFTYPPPPPLVEAGQSNGVSASTLLYQGDVDETYLTPYQCELRKHLEVFVASSVDVRASASPGRTGLVQAGQVGIRCRHCAGATIHPNLAHRTGGAVYYSKSIAGIYQLAQNMAKGHLMDRCYYIPPPEQERLTVLRGDNRRAGRGKEYWTESIMAMGVYESTSESILRLRNNNNNNNSPNTTTETSTGRV